MRGSEAPVLRDMLETIFAASPLPIFIADRETSEFLYGNPAAIEAFGIPESEFAGTRGATLYTNPGDRQRFLDTLDAQGVVSNVPVELRRADGSPLHVVVTARSFLYEGRETLLLAFTDLDGKLAAEAALREAEARYRSVFDFAPVPIYLHDGDRIRVANLAAVALYGFESDDTMRGVPIIELITPQDRPRFQERLAEMRRTPRPLPFVEDRRVRQDGTQIVVEQSGTPIEVNGEQLILAVNLDVTASKEAEAVLRQSQKMEAIGQLTGGVTHDFNNLLSIILGNVDLLKHSPAFDPSLERYVKTIEGAVQRGADLTARLLTFARRQSLKPEVLDLGALLAENVDLLSRTLGGRISLRTAQSAVLWRVRADRSQLETALLNLVLNARDAMPRGGRLSIEIANTEIEPTMTGHDPDLSPGRYVSVSVTDTGEGIPPEIAERVFEPFFTTKPDGKGTGLGLSMVFGFVTQSGGHVRVDSRPGAGTRFVMYLPAAEESDVPEEERASWTDRGQLRGQRILLVEDNAPLRQVVRAMLENAGLEVSEAHDSDSAVKALSEQEPFDLLLTDIVFPAP